MSEFLPEIDFRFGASLIREAASVQRSDRFLQPFSYSAFENKLGGDVIVVPKFIFAQKKTCCADAEVQFLLFFFKS
jgi:hypothetical protein